MFHVVSILLGCQFFYIWSSCHIEGGWSFTNVPVINQVSLSQTEVVDFCLFVEFEMSNPDLPPLQESMSCCQEMKNIFD